MSLNEVEFNRRIQDDNGNFFEFKYRGIAKESANIDSTVKLLNKFMHQIWHNDMVKNVKFLKTILCDYNQKSLVLVYKGNEINQVLEFNNSNMTLFKECGITNANNCDEKFSIEYIPGKRKILTFKEPKNKKAGYSNLKSIYMEANSFFDKVDLIQSVQPIKLNDNTKRIIEAYKLFYDKNPDFTNESINDEIQSMASILLSFGLEISYNSSFSPTVSEDSNLLKAINELFPLGEITDIDTISIIPEKQEVIKAIGKEIRNYVDNANIDLISISKIIGIAKYCSSYGVSMDDMIKCTDCSKKDILSGMILIKKISNSI